MTDIVPILLSPQILKQTQRKPKSFINLFYLFIGPPTMCSFWENIHVCACNNYTIYLYFMISVTSQKLHLSIFFLNPYICEYIYILSHRFNRQINISGVNIPFKYEFEFHLYQVIFNERWFINKQLF